MENGTALIDGDTFESLQRHVRSRTALELSLDKEYAVRARLNPVLATFGIATVEDLVASLLQRSNAELDEAVCEALTPTDSAFFRDPHVFGSIRDHILPQLLDQLPDGQPLTIWSGACGPGQEAVSLLILIAERFPQLLEPGNLRLFCSDVSPTMVLRATQATYTRIEVNRGLREDHLAGYFERDGKRWRLTEPLRAHLNVRCLNLVGPWAAAPKADLILMRNVLGGFSAKARAEVTQRIRDEALASGGLLVLGMDESIESTDGLAVRQHGSTEFYTAVG